MVESGNGSIAITPHRTPLLLSRLPTTVLMAWALTPLTDEQREIQRVAREFAEREIAPYADEWDREQHFLWRSLGNHDLTDHIMAVQGERTCGHCGWTNIVPPDVRKPESARLGHR